MPDDAPAAPSPSTPPSPPQGGFLKLLPLVLVGLALGLWVMRPASPTAKAEAELSKAREAADAGRWLEAAPTLVRLAKDRSIPDAALRTRALALLDSLATRAVTEKRPLAETAALLDSDLEVLEETNLAAEVTGVASTTFTGTIDRGTLAKATDRAKDEAEKDPKGACALTATLVRVLEGSDLWPAAREARTKALDAEIAKDPKDVAALVARAGIDLAQDKDDEARARLEPVSSELGAGEGARILGLARLRTGAVAEGVAFLGSYYEAAYPAFERATEGLRGAIDASQRRAQLEPALAKRIRDARTDEERKKLFETSVAEQVRSDPEVRAARRAVIAAAPLVDVALALAQAGIVEARGKAEAERTNLLDRAEKYLWSVREVGSGNDNWWVWVARLKIEEGKSEDVESVLDSYTAGRGQSYASLFVAAQVLAEASHLDKARTRAEGAFERAKTPEDKARAAQLRASVAEDPRDQLAWLERAGTGPDAQAMVAQARASLALGEGRFEDATRGFEDAEQFYAKAPEPSPARIHGALLSLAKAEASGKRDDLDAAIGKLSAVAKHEPVPLAVLDALADALTERAVTAVVGDRLRTDILHDRSLDVLDFAAADEHEAAALETALAASADMKRALALREEAIAQAPRRAKPFAALLAVGARLRDAGSLEKLATRIEKAELDRTEESRQLTALWSGKDDETQRQGFAARRKRADAIVALARASGHAPTLASALATRAAIEREAASLLAPGDHDLAVKLDEEGLAAAPRRFTRLALRNALLARAAEHERASVPALEALVQKHGKVGFVTLLGWAVRGDAGLAAKLARDPDVKRAVELHAQSLGPETEAATHEWLVFAIAGDPRAQEAGKKVAASPLALAVARVSLLLGPESPELVNELATVLELRGEKDARKKLLEQAKKAKVPLPYELLEKNDSK